MSSRERFKLSVSVFALVRQADKVLSLRRSGTGWLDGHWSVPAGALHGDEPLAAAACRELLEETGISVSSEQAQLCHTQHVFMPKAEWLGFYFEINVKDAAPQLGEVRKHDRMEWLDLRTISEPVVPYVQAALIRVANGSSYSTFRFA